jgi:menaquinone-dependent protoporphyrinogen IX oxidase
MKGKKMERRQFIKLGFAGIGSLALTQKTQALEYYPKASDKKCAVVYSTWCGSSRDAGVWISEGMGGIADVFDVREKPDLKGYEHIVIGGSIRSFATSPELQDFISKNKEIMKGKVCGLFAVCGNMGNPITPDVETRYINNHLAKLCEVTDVPSKVLNGRITKSLMDPQSAQMMGSFDDYDKLKRDECMALGKEILEKIK